MFYIIKKSEYLQTAVPQLKRLKMDTFGHDSVILHEIDIAKKKGCFAQLGKDARQEFMNRLSGLIQELDFTVIAVIIDKAKHKAKYHRPEHPYHLALQFGLERLHQFLKMKESEGALTHVICEARGKKEDGDLELAFRRVCDGANRTRKTYALSMVIADKKTNSEGLQIADLLARPIGLSHVRPEQENRAYEMLKLKFFAGQHGVIDGNGRKVFP